MAYTNDPSDPAHMSPDEHLAEVATILAQGVLRLRRTAAVLPVKTSVESCVNRLDDCAVTRPDGHNG